MYNFVQWWNSDFSPRTTMKKVVERNFPGASFIDFGMDFQYAVQDGYRKGFQDGQERPVIREVKVKELIGILQFRLSETQDHYNKVVGGENEYLEGLLRGEIMVYEKLISFLSDCEKNGSL